MILNYLKSAIRNITYNKTYSLINILGVAIGTAAFFMILQYVMHERSYDKFNDNSDRIYRLRYERLSENGESVRFASCCPPAALKIRDQYSEVENVARIFRYRATIAFGETVFTEDRMYFAEHEILDILKFDFIDLDAPEALRQPNNAFISRSTSNRYFGNINCIGKTISFNGKVDYRVSGVYEDNPSNSHLKIDILLSYPSLIDIYGDDIEESWGDTGFFTYLRIREGANPRELEKSFAEIGIREWGEVLDYYKITMEFPMQPLEEIHLTSNYMQEYEVNGDEDSVNFLFIISIFILLMAWVNYVNLTTARSLQRAKEIGIRKVIGASRNQVSLQIFFETVLVNFIAILLAIGIIVLTKNYFSNFTGIPTDLNIWNQSWFWKVLPLLFVGGIVLSGFYPVLVLSSFKPIEIVKGKFESSKSGLRLRKALVVFQFVIALVLFAGTITVYKQISYMKQQNLGFDIEQTLVLKTPRVRDETFPTKLESFKQLMIGNSDIKNVCVSTEVPGRQILWDAGGILKAGEDMSQAKNYQIVGVDYDFVDFYELEIVTGRNYSREFPSDPGALMLNETAAQWLGFESPESAVKGEVQYWGEIYPVIGVLKDFHQQSLKQEFEPHIFRFMPTGRGTRGTISIKVNTENISSTLNFVENNWNDFFPGNPFDYFFLDEYFNQQYKADEQFGDVFGLFAFLAIIITALGIFGLSAFAVSQRVKEIGIRKVLGSSISQVLYLLVKDVLILLTAAIVITIPLVYYGIEKWLEDFAFRMSLNAWIFILPFILVGLITLLTVSYQTVKAAIANPVESLRDE
jgi:putative ABC transport system permease protein